MQGMTPFGGSGGHGGAGYEGDFIVGPQPDPSYLGPSQYGPQTPGYGEFGSPSDPNWNPMAGMWNEYMSPMEDFYGNWINQWGSWGAEDVAPWQDVSSNLGYLQNWAGGYGAPSLNPSLSTNPWGGGQGLYDVTLSTGENYSMGNPDWNQGMGAWQYANMNPLRNWFVSGGFPEGETNWSGYNPMSYFANPQSYVASTDLPGFGAGGEGELPGAFIGSQLYGGTDMGMRDLFAGGLPALMSESIFNAPTGDTNFWNRGEMPSWALPGFLDPTSSTVGDAGTPDYTNIGSSWQGMSDLLFGAGGNPTDIWARPEGWSDLLGQWGYGAGQQNYSNMANWSVDWDAIQEQLGNRRGGRNNIGSLSNYAMGA